MTDLLTLEINVFLKFEIVLKSSVKILLVKKKKHVNFCPFFHP